MSGISGWYDSYEKRFVGEQSVTRTFGEKRYTVVYSGIVRWKSNIGILG